MPHIRSDAGYTACNRQPQQIQSHLHSPEFSNLVVLASLFSAVRQGRCLSSQQWTCQALQNSVRTAGCCLQHGQPQHIERSCAGVTSERASPLGPSRTGLPERRSSCKAGSADRASTDCQLDTQLLPSHSVARFGKAPATTLVTRHVLLPAGADIFWNSVAWGRATKHQHSRSVQVCENFVIFEGSAAARKHAKSLLYLVRALQPGYPRCGCHSGTGRSGCSDCTGAGGSASQ